MRVFVRKGTKLSIRSYIVGVKQSNNHIFKSSAQKIVIYGFERLDLDNLHLLYYHIMISHLDVRLNANWQEGITASFF